MLSPAGTEILARFVLAVAALAVGLGVGRLLAASPFSPLQSFFYGLNFVMTRVLWRAQVSGPLPVVPGQGAVVVCNHRSPVDPTFVYLTTHRMVHWMVAGEYFKLPVVSWFLRLCESIPTNRSGVDTRATRMAIRYLQRGDMVGMFPEGRINNTRELLMPGRSGAALMALKARVPVIPCYASGSPYDGTTFGCLFMPAKVRLAVGRPIDLCQYYDRANDRQLQKELTLRFLGEIARLAGRPDYRPRLAGRRYREPVSRWRHEEGEPA